MSGGAGSRPAGSAPAGSGLPATTAARLVAKPTVAYFDPGTMTTPMLADGSLRAIHPVDAQVILAMAIRKGQIASVPDQGNTLDRLGRVAPAQLPALALDAVEQALGGPLAREDIELLSVTATEVLYGGLYVVVSYRNLRASNALPRTVTQSP